MESEPERTLAADELDETPIQRAEVPETDTMDRSRSRGLLSTQLSLRYQRERRFAAIADEIVQGLYPNEVLDHVYESFRAVIPFDRLGCALLEDEGRIARAYWSRSESTDLHLKQGYSAQMAGSSLQRIIDTGQPRIIDDLRDYFQQHPDSESTRLVLADGIRSNLTCPLIARGKPIGFLFFSSNTPGTYKGVHRRAYLRLAEMVSTVIEKSRLYEELDRANSELVQSRDRLEYSATHDSLTEVWNRATILAILQTRVERARRQSAGVALLIADCDRFKHLNDTLGHQAGDEALRAVSKAVASALRVGDELGRVGGDEFVIVADARDAEDGLHLAERVRHAVDNTLAHWNRNPLDCSVSIGVSFWSPIDEPTSTEDLLTAADIALYRAKSLGRNRVAMAGEDTADEALAGKDPASGLHVPGDRRL